MDEKIKQYHKELTAVIEKFQEETHAGLLIKHALDLFITYAYESCNDLEKASEMIQNLVDQHKTYFISKKEEHIGMD